MGIDPEKLFVVFVIALVVLGPERLPQAARTLGRGLAHLRRYSALVRAEVDDVLAEPRAIIHSAAREVEIQQGTLRGSPPPLPESAPLADRAGPIAGTLSPGVDIQRSAPDDPSLN